MLHEGYRAIKPEDVVKQIPTEKLEGIVILGLGKLGEPNQLMMSTVTVAELCFLAKQLDAHITCLLGPMQES